MKSVIDWIKKNQGTTAALLVAVVMAGLAVGCEIKTASPFTGEMVTQRQLEQQAMQATADYEAELARINADIEALKASKAVNDAGVQAAVEELERKREAMLMGLDFAQKLMAGVPSPWSDLANLGLGALVVGLGIDNRRKDGVIKGQKLASRTD